MTTHWVRWHEAYEDPTSALAQRLRAVQDAVAAWADAAPSGPMRVLSLCAGQAHDVCGALAGHRRRADVTGLLVELDEENAAAAAGRARAAGLDGLRVRRADAGRCSSFADGVPAELVLVCGVFGNVEEAHVRGTVAALPSLCAPGATVVWTRHRREPDLVPSVRAWFADAGFEEVDLVSPGAGTYAVGVARLAATPLPFDPRRVLFSFRDG